VVINPVRKAAFVLGWIHLIATARETKIMSRERGKQKAKQDVQVETRTQSFSIMDHNAKEVLVVEAINSQDALFIARQDPMVRLASQKSGGLWVLPLKKK
jgi:hypothetical protein